MSIEILQFHSQLSIFGIKYASKQPKYDSKTFLDKNLVISDRISADMFSWQEGLPCSLGIF
ncbi:MAG: hypothetical protein RMY34_20225 [Aulosira sp. DedQUE10]|nr:hypothetical protein [Aulosira sp. DedQUE10]